MHATVLTEMLETIHSVQSHISDNYPVHAHAQQWVDVIALCLFVDTKMSPLSELGTLVDFLAMYKQK